MFSKHEQFGEIMEFFFKAFEALAHESNGDGTQSSFEQQLGNWEKLSFIEITYGMALKETLASLQRSRLEDYVPNLSLESTIVQVEDAVSSPLSMCLNIRLRCVHPTAVVQRCSNTTFGGCPGPHAA